MCNASCDHQVANSARSLRGCSALRKQGASELGAEASLARSQSRARPQEGQV